MTFYVRYLRGEFKCGWANAVARSKKAGSFMPLSEIEKVPAPRQLPKTPRPTENHRVLLKN